LQGAIHILNDFLLDESVVLVPLPCENVVRTPRVVPVRSEIEAIVGSRLDFLRRDAERYGKQE
jgi:hypothetical protein